MNEFFGVFYLERGDFTWPKPNNDLGHEDALGVSESDKNVTSLIDTCLHTAAQKQIVYVKPCTFSKSYYELILIYKFEQKYYTTCSGGAKLFVYSIYVYGRQVGIGRGSVGIGRSQVRTYCYKSSLSLHKSGLGLQKSGLIVTSRY